MISNISIVLPARNESESLRSLLPELKKQYGDAEIIVVNDGSTDDTTTICAEHDVICVTHRYRMGNGAAVKTGMRYAHGDVVVLMDADGQHRVDEIDALLNQIKEGFDMAVGARNRSSHASVGRLLANSFYNRFASWMTGQRVEDLTSGFRAVRSEHFREFLHLLPNGFSYPTTITMAFFRAGYPVAYVPITAEKRLGQSHIRPVRDGIRFLLIIFRVGSLYSPLKIFVPFSLLFFLVGAGYYLYTYITDGRFTNMSALLLTNSVLIFLIGLISEQVTTLIYSSRDHGAVEKPES